jgi:putative chitinase
MIAAEHRFSRGKIMSATALQQNLKAKGFNPGIIDGLLGKDTYQALASYISDGRAPEGTGGLLALHLKGGDITNRLRKIHFFAQVTHESGFRPVEENLNYSVAGLKATFSRQRISAAQCEALGRAPGRPSDKVAIANAVYGGVWGKNNLGNTQPGDGHRYRGRGLIQLTGRSNYRRTGAEYEVNPDLVLTPAGSIKAAVDFWRTRGLNAASDADDVTRVTKIINGGDKGLAERKALTAKLKAIWPA